MAGALSSEAAPAVEQPGAAEPAAPAEPAPAPEPSARLARFGTDIRRRFGFAYLLLAVAVGVAVGLFVVLAARPGGESGGPWSPWQPTEHGNAALKQIADRVAPQYRLASGRQIVAVALGAPQVLDLPISAVAVRSGFADEPLEDIEVYPAQRSAMLQLCGLGANCAISEGEPSLARAQLLRREGLELALYAFAYLDGVDSVLAFIPPPLGVDLEKRPEFKRTLYFRKADFENELRRPLRLTVSLRDDVRPNTLTSRDIAVVDRLTNERLFRYEFQQLPNGTAIMVLAPVTA